MAKAEGIKEDFEATLVIIERVICVNAIANCTKYDQYNDQLVAMTNLMQSNIA